MPTHQRHRGTHPDDSKLFNAEGWNKLIRAAGDLSLLWTKGYGENAAKNLVGDHFRLTARQRLALVRITLSQQMLVSIKKLQCSAIDMRNSRVIIDGFNMLIFGEALLSQAFLFQGMDGVFRDIASVHGTYKKVEETGRAAHLVGTALRDLDVAMIIWYLDAPVSNSGRVRNFLLSNEFACYDWQVEVLHNPDRTILGQTDGHICSSDRQLISRRSWYNLSRDLISIKSESQVTILQNSEWSHQS